MCTILTVDCNTFSKSKDEFVDLVYQDYASNPDGSALLLYSEIFGFTSLRTMDIESIINVLALTQWDRFWLHQRFATQGEASIDNVHGWSAKGIHFMHNGCLYSKRAKFLPVDSMLIGHWLKDGGANGALFKLEREYFANVFLIDTKELEYYVSRSFGGSLFTDGSGNYSTHKVSAIDVPVNYASQSLHSFDGFGVCLLPGESETGDQSWFDLAVNK